MKDFIMRRSDTSHNSNSNNKRKLNNDKNSKRNKDGNENIDQCSDQGWRKNLEFEIDQWLTCHYPYDKKEILTSWRKKEKEKYHLKKEKQEFLM